MMKKKHVAGLVYLFLMIFLCGTAYPLWQEDKVDLWPIFTYDDNPTKINFLWPITMYRHEPDETSFALRPIFHSASEGDEYNLDLIWPFGKYSSEGKDKRKAYFWPVSYYSKYNDEKKFYIFPIYYHRDGNEKSYNVIPVFHYSDENFYLFPFYMHTEEHSKTMFTPLFYYGSEPNKKKFWLLNTYYENDLASKERTEVFFPIYFRGYDKNSRWLYIVPICGRYDGKTSSKTIALFPLYLDSKHFKSDDKKEIKSQNTYFLWPLGRYNKSDGKKKAYFWPVSYYSGDNDKKKFYIFPIYYHRDGDEKSYNVIPLFHYSDENFYLFPFYMHTEEHSKTMFAPLFYYSNEPNKKKFWLLNTYYENDLIAEEKKFCFSPFYYHRNRDEKSYGIALILHYWNKPKGKAFGLLNTYYKNDRDAKEREEVIFPIYFRGYDKNSKWLYIIPIGGKYEEKSKSKTMALFPLYFNTKHFKDNDKKEVKNSETHFLWPLGKHSKNYSKKDKMSCIRIFPLFKKEVKGQKKSGYAIWPLYWFSNDNKAKYHYTLWPLFHYFKSCAAHYTPPLVICNIGENTKPEFKDDPILHGKTLRVFPFYGQGYRKTSAHTYKYCCFPLHMSVRHLKSLEKVNKLGAYEKDYKQETYYRDFYERDYKRYHTGIVSWYWKENGKIITKEYPDNKKDTKPSDTKEITYKRSGFALWPFYYYKSFNNKDGHYFIWPLFGLPKQHILGNNKLSKWDWDFIFPIGEYTQENEKIGILYPDYNIKSSLEYDAKNNLKTVGLWPLYKYQKKTSKVDKEQFRSRHSFLWPLGKIVINKDKNGKEFTGQRFFPMYWSERQKDNNKTVQRTKLWPIFGYGMDDKGKYSLSLVSPFPTLENPEGYETNWAPYFSLYHIQVVKNEYKESFVLYRLYRHYKSASERQLQIWMLYDYLKQKDRIKVNLLKGFLGYEKHHNKKYMRLLYFKIPIGNKGTKS